MLEDHLIMFVFEKNRILIEGMDSPLEPDAAYQEYIHWNLFFLATC